MKDDYTSAYQATKNDSNTIAIEVSKGKGKTKQEAIAAGDFNAWTKERIKAAFNFGNGTMKDFHQYINNNKKYCWVDVL